VDIFEKTPNGVVQHGPCPYCGEWNCSHDDLKLAVLPNPEEARKQTEEALGRL